MLKQWRKPNHLTVRTNVAKHLVMIRLADAGRRAI
jgi:hypothetical protein